MKASKKKRDRSKTTELRPSNEDLGKSCYFIDCLAGGSISSMFIQFTTHQAVWALTRL